MSIVSLKDKMKRDLITTYMRKGFEDPDDLYFYIQHLLGYTVPRKKFCPEHDAPWDFISDVFFDKVRFIFAFGSRTSGKCVHEDTLILDTRTGLRHRIADVVNENKLENILTLTRDQQIVEVPIASGWYTGINNCLQFALESGRTITTTYEHPFLTKYGWRKAAILQVGTEIAVCGNIPFPHNPVIINNDDLQKLSAIDLFYADKIPDIAFQLNREQLLEYIHALYSNNLRIYPSLRFKQERVAHDLQHLLLRLGKHVSIRIDYNGLYFYFELTSINNDSDIYYEPIEHIERLNNVKTYDLTVEPTHNFIANDIIVHNTWSIALLNHLQMMYRQCPIEITLAAGTLDQTQKGYKYFVGFFDDPAFEKFVQSSIQSKTILTNGSELQITAGTLKGLNGAHSQVMVLDELETMSDYALLGEALSISMSKLDKVNNKFIPAKDIWSCIAGDTLIKFLTTDGFVHIPVQSLVGMQFTTLSLDVNAKTLVHDTVYRVWKTKENAEVFKLSYKTTCRNNNFLVVEYNHLIATKEHLILLKQGLYKQLQSLKPDDLLYSTKDNCVECRVLSIEKHGYEDVYDIEVVHNSNFSANDIIIHNSTRKFQSGLVSRVLEEAEEKNMTISSFCVSGETIVRSPNGDTRIRDLVGKTIDVYTINGTIKKHISVKKAFDIKMTRSNALVYKVTYDINGQENYVIATPDHYFMLHDGSYKQLVHLEINKDYLMPFDPKNAKVAITSIKQCGHEDVYCLNVEDTHNFAANDIFVHNCIWETLEQCTRKCKGDPQYGDCLVWDKCQGKAHECSGWYPIADFIQKSVNLSKATFSTQWENKSPSGGHKVFAETWDESIHVLSHIDGGKFRSFYSIFHEKEIPKSWKRIGGMDFGANFATILIAIEPRYDIYIVYFEYFYNKERLMATHAQNVKDAPGFHKGLRIFADPSGKQSILEMRAYGLRGVIPGMNNLLEGVDEVKKRLGVNPVNGLPKLFVMDNCIELRKEFREWEHETMSDGRADLESFEDGNDHCFVAGTLIETDRGLVPIEDIKIGDLAFTRLGFKPVVIHWETDPVDVMTVFLSNGSKLTGTPDHPIYTYGNEIILLKDLQKGNKLYQSCVWKLDTDPTQIKTLYVTHVMKEFIQQKVYNLTVKDAHEYFANGILVSNCLDAARYAIFTYPRLPRTTYRFATVDGI